MPKKKTDILTVDQEIIDVCRESIEDKKGVGFIVLSPGAESSVADHFVIAAAESEPQLRAMASAVERAVREKVRRRPLSTPADSVSGWVLLDYGNVLVHLMTPEARVKYNLEGLWGDAPAESLHRLAGLKSQDE